jgi:uncharacterized membrane protein
LDERGLDGVVMLSWRLLILFVHVTAVIVALGGSLFSTFALAPILAEELAPAERIRVASRVVGRLGVIVLSALAILILTGIANTLFLGAISFLLAVKLLLVVAVIVLALYQYGNLGVRLRRIAARGPDPALAPLQARFRRVGIMVGTLVLVIVYLSLGLTRGAGATAIVTLW